MNQKQNARTLLDLYSSTIHEAQNYTIKQYKEAFTSAGLLYTVSR